MPKSQSSFASLGLRPSPTVVGFGRRRSEDKEKNKLHYGFLDESGILEKKAGAGNYFIISVIIVANPAEIKNVIKIARNKSKGKFRSKGIFKAAHANSAFTKAILCELAKKNIEIIIGIMDKKQKETRLDKNILYGKLVAKTIALALSIYPKFNLIIHKRYMLPRIQNQLKQIIAETMRLITKTCIFIDQKTETECRELELADAVAWAVFQKYNNKREEFYKIIKNKIVKENRLAA